MIALSEAVGSWLYPPGGAGTVPERALVLGAGFTKSCWGGAPSFEDLGALLRDRLSEAGEAGKNALAKAGPSDLVELLDHRKGRAEVARAVLAEPSGTPRLYPPFDPASRPPAARSPSAFRSLKQWKEALEASSPTHLDPLRPDGAALMLGRLVAEGVVGEILTTNWDAYIELGCLLAGVCVCDGDEQVDGKPLWLQTLDHRLWVYETARDAAFRPRPRHGTVLFKLHGGIRSLQRILTDLLEARARPEEVDSELRSSFLVATEDLIHWEVPSQWVADVTADVLRSHSVLTIGVSGSDPVLYRAFRTRVREWERSRREVETPAAMPLPALVGTDKYPKARTLNMLTLDEARGRPSVPLAVAGGAEVLRAAYAQWLLEGRLLAAAGSSSWPSVLAARLLGRLRTEVDSLPDCGAAPQAPRLVPVLCDALGPGARWAAIAELKGPFSRMSGASEPFRRWWYAPWPDEIPGDHARELVSFLALVVEDPVAVDSWSGLIRVAPGKLLEKLRELGLVTSGQEGGVSFLPLPWPWRETWGLDGPWLWQELSVRFHWGPGMGLESLARAPVWIVPLPALPTNRRTALVGGVRASVFRPPEESVAKDFWWDLALGWFGTRGDP